MKASSWKQLILESSPIKYTPTVLNKIKEAGGPTSNAEKIFADLSRNKGVALLALDVSEQLILFHNPTLLGGSWLDEELKTVALHGLGEKATAIRIIPKSVKDVRARAPKLTDISHTINNGQDLSSVKTTTETFHYKNIIPIPDFLIKAFVLTDPPTPGHVSTAFYSTLKHMDSLEHAESETEEEQQEAPNNEDNTSTEESSHEKTPLTSSKTTKEKSGNSSSILSTFEHVLQFCYLCIKEKIPPVNYTISNDEEITTWHERLEQSHILKYPPPPTSVLGPSGHLTESSFHDDDDTTTSTRSLRESEKDTHIVNTLLKISEVMDQNTLRAAEEKEKKDPGFKKLEPHRQQLILNASSTHPFESQATTPTPFYMEFLAQKQQFKAKELLCHHLAKNKILFQPSAAFASHLYLVDWVWPNPNKPSGISIFFCPDSASEEKNENYHSFEKGLALVEKIEKSDISKLTKQTITLPHSNMNTYLMVTNFKAVIELCFGPESQSAICLQSWCDHIFYNRQIYLGWEESDPTFYTKVLFAIDKSLQIHWKSCYDNEDRSSVNDKILCMQQLQSDIESQRFFYQLPKYLLDKIKSTDDTSEKDKDKYKNGGGLHNKKRLLEEKKDLLKKQRITENFHTQWHLKDGESFSEIFYPHQDKCPKTKEGTFICMKYFIRGFCDKACSRAHKVSKQEEKEFETFLNNCRKKDFRQGAGPGTPP